MRIPGSSMRRGHKSSHPDPRVLYEEGTEIVTSGSPGPLYSGGWSVGEDEEWTEEWSEGWSEVRMVEAYSLSIYYE